MLKSLKSFAPKFKNKKIAKFWAIENSPKFRHENDGNPKRQPTLRNKTKPQQREEERVCSGQAEMGFGHAALCTVTVFVLYCAMMVSSSPSSPASRAQLVFESSKSLTRTYGPLKQASPSKHSYQTRVTKLPPPPVIIPPPPPTIPSNSSNNGTSNGTEKIEVCMDCVC